MGIEELALSALAVIPISAGMIVGQSLRKRMDGPVFTKLILGFMVFLAVSLMAKAL